MPDSSAKIERIPLDIIDKDGKKRQAVLRAQIFETSTRQKVLKQAVGGSAASNAQEEDPFRRMIEGKGVIIDPPYNLDELSLAADNSNELGGNIRTMVTNTVSFGWRLREPADLDEELRNKFDEEIKNERYMLRSKLSAVHPKDSFQKIREKIKHDKWLTGNGYMELIENARGELVGLNHVHAHTIRLTALDDKPVPVLVPSVRPDQGFIIEKTPMMVRFRRFVQMWGNSLIFFKEAGDPRQLNKCSGEFAKPGEVIPLDKRATSLIHHKIYAPYSPYGVPVWMGNLFSFYGSRAAEEINYTTMSNNSVPSMFIIVENGVLSDGSISRVKEFIESQSEASQNYSKCILLEGEPLEEGSPSPSSFKIKIEPVKKLQTTDELWQDFDKNNREKIRQSFRLPGIFLGRTSDYNRSTADTARDIADEQIFAPDRDDDDQLINRHILPAWGSRFHVFKSMHPNITDDIELIRLMGIAERSGGMTPRRADRIIRDVFGEDIGPMPTGIDPDKPFSISFAEAQKQGGVSMENIGQGGDPVRATVDRLLNIRKQIEDELDSRSGRDKEEE